MLLVDTADQNAILNALKFPGVQGFTTNPALMARAAGAEALSLDEYVAAARKLCRMSAEIGAIRQLMIQSVGGPDETRRQAILYLDDLKTAREKKLWIKLAPTAPSLACCQALKDIGCASLATAVFTAAQAYVAMEAGADGVAVYLGRLMRHERDSRAPNGPYCLQVSPIDKLSKLDFDIVATSRRRRPFSTTC
ncbi:MAG: hypothetical protein FD172_3436 [Methylocystaceae bacterium]|nr:MAG: hypothetical protein FD172_3436 [Methylocystaceae bacterium]